MTHLQRAEAVIKESTDAAAKFRNLADEEAKVLNHEAAAALLASADLEDFTVEVMREYVRKYEAKSEETI